MKVFRTNRLSQAGVFSLNNAQIHIGDIARDGAATEKGMSISGSVLGELPVERAFPLSKDKALSLVAFLDCLLEGEFPCAVSVKIGFMERFHWKVKRFDAAWHHGGAYVGRFSYGGLMGGSMVSAKITKTAAKELRQCLVKFFDIAT